MSFSLDYKHVAVVTWVLFTTNSQDSRENLIFSRQIYPSGHNEARGGTDWRTQSNSVYHCVWPWLTSSNMCVLCLLIYRTHLTCIKVKAHEIAASRKDLLQCKIITTLSMTCITNHIFYVTSCYLKFKIT